MTLAWHDSPHGSLAGRLEALLGSFGNAKRNVAAYVALHTCHKLVPGYLLKMCSFCRAKQDAAERDAVSTELSSCKNVAALVEKQKHDAVREGALLRDEIVALRSKISNLTAERDVVRGTVEAEKAKVRDLEDLLQALRAKEHAALNAEQVSCDS